MATIEPNAALLSAFMAAFLLILLPEITIVERAPALFDQRLIWENILKKHSKHSAFKRHLQMSPTSFAKLLSYLPPALEADHVQALQRGGIIMPEIRLYCMIRWLAGGSYSNIYMFAGISKASFYRICWQTIHAICKYDQLKIQFP
jgi:hypothetical protein